MRATDAITALSALAHEHRLALYRLLVARGPEGLSAGRIGERLGLLPSSLTFHLQHLQRAGLITRQRQGRHLVYAADFSVMNGLVGYLTENCCGQSSAAAECATACGPAARASLPRRLRRSA